MKPPGEPCATRRTMHNAANHAQHGERTMHGWTEENCIAAFPDLRKRLTPKCLYYSDSEAVSCTVGHGGGSERIENNPPHGGTLRARDQGYPWDSLLTTLIWFVFTIRARQVVPRACRFDVTKAYY